MKTTNNPAAAAAAPVAAKARATKTPAERSAAALKAWETRRRADRWTTPTESACVAWVTRREIEEALGA
jgi:hypothetical protein